MVLVTPITRGGQCTNLSDRVRAEVLTFGLLYPVSTLPEARTVNEVQIYGCGSFLTGALQQTKQIRYTFSEVSYMPHTSIKKTLSQNYIRNIPQIMCVCIKIIYNILKAI